MRSFVIVSLLAAGAAFHGIARADAIISAPSVIALPGSSGDFDILLTNTGSSTVAVGAFTFAISTSSSEVNFTSASTTTTAAPYIFEGNSFDAINGLPLATRTGQDLTASDIANNAIQSFLNSATTLSLGKVFYTISPSARFEAVDIAFSSTATSLSDYLGRPVPATTVNGQITLAPEPRQTAVVAALLGVLFVFSVRRARVRKRV